jgi:hypothetical protein
VASSHAPFPDLVLTTEHRIPAAYAWRHFRRLADQPLDRLNHTFIKLHPDACRLSTIPTHKLAFTLQAT